MADSKRKNKSQLVNVQRTESEEEADGTKTSKAPYGLFPRLGAMEEEGTDSKAESRKTIANRVFGTDP